MNLLVFEIVSIERDKHFYKNKIIARNTEKCNQNNNTLLKISEYN